MRILIVEDSKPTQHLLRSRLEQAGFSVDTADNGHQGFRRATSSAYDIILSDIVMPHWDGFKFIEAIQVVNPALPILIITSSHEDRSIEDRLRSYDNVLGVLAKPFDFDALFKQLASIPSQSHTSVNKKPRSSAPLVRRATLRRCWAR